MTRCNKCGIDRDRCSCNNRVRNFIAYPIIAFSLILMATGCYTEKKASRQVVKAYVEYPEIVSGHCGLWFEPIIMTKDSFIYKQGKTIYKQGEPVYVQVDCDSVVNSSTIPNSSKKAVKIPCPPCDSVRVDTNYISSRNTEVNKANEHNLELQVKTQGEVIAGQKVTINILTWIAGLLGAYTLLRWILRIWNIKLP